MAQNHAIEPLVVVETGKAFEAQAVYVEGGDLGKSVGRATLIPGRSWLIPSIYRLVLRLLTRTPIRRFRDGRF